MPVTLVGLLAVLAVAGGDIYEGQFFNQTDAYRGCAIIIYTRNRKIDLKNA
jgi:hypothetical protein